MILLLAASLTVPQTLRPLSTGRSPALSTAAARARHQAQQPSFVPLATRYRDKHAPVSTREHAVGNTRAQMELMQGFVHRTGMHSKDSVPSKGLAPVPNLKPPIEPPAAAHQTVPTAREAVPAPAPAPVLGGLRRSQKSRRASQVARAADEVALVARVVVAAQELHHAQGPGVHSNCQLAASRRPQ